MSAACTAAFAQSSFSDILGKSLTNEDGTVVINRDGTVTGTLGGNDLALDWSVEGGKWCREGKLGSNDVPKKCQTIRIKGDQISFIDANGSVSSAYTIE